MKSLIINKISRDIVTELKKNNISSAQIAKMLDKNIAIVHRIFRGVESFSLNDLSKIIIGTEVLVGLIVLNHLINSNSNLPNETKKAYIYLQDSLNNL